MDTLVGDLRFLLDQHFSTIEDIFINNVSRINTKNVKVSVRLGDWKSTLYHLQRWRYQEFIFEQAYYGACQRGDYELMQLFDYDFTMKGKNSIKIKVSLKHLAKYRHYELIDTKILPKFGIRGVLQFPILQGLIAANEFDIIKSGKYVEINSNNLQQYHSGVGGCIRTALKYNRKEILDFFESIGGDALIQEHGYNVVIGTIKGSQPINITDIKQYIDDLDFALDLLIKSHRFDLAEELAGSDFDRRLRYAVGLVKADRHDLLKKLLKLECVDSKRYNTFLTRLYLEIDDLNHFKICHKRSSIDYEQLVVYAINCSSLNVLKYLFEIDKDKDHCYNGLGPIKDPKIIDLIIEKRNKGNRFFGTHFFIENNLRQGYNLIVKLW